MSKNILSLSLIVLVLFSTSTFASEKNMRLEITPLAPNVYLHNSYKKVNGFGLVEANGLVVIDHGKAFIVDTPWSTKDTKALVSWIKKKGYKVAASISTHSHEDRTAGIAYLNSQSIKTYASELTNQILSKNGAATATQSFSQSEFWLEKELIKVSYHGKGHTVDNVLVWLPQSKILFGGCFIRSLDEDGLGYTGEAFVSEWEASADKVIAAYPDVRIVVPGHGAYGDAALLKHTKKLANMGANQKP